MRISERQCAIAGGAREGAGWVAPIGEVKRWFASAEPGERIAYAHGPQLIRGETSRFVQVLALSARADPVLKRADDGAFDYFVQKRRFADEPGSRVEERRAAAREDEAQDIIFRVLRRCANAGLRAPSNAALATHAGLATRNEAAWRIRKLIEAGKIKVETVPNGPEAGWRTVTIVASGKQTMAPMSFDRLRTSGGGR
jgi:hypothetical protein